jgi:hypothetical protein
MKKEKERENEWKGRKRALKIENQCCGSGSCHVPGPTSYCTSIFCPMNN